MAGSLSLPLPSGEGWGEGPHTPWPKPLTLPLSQRARGLRCIVKKVVWFCTSEGSILFTTTPFQFETEPGIEVSV